VYNIFKIVSIVTSFTYAVLLRRINRDDTSHCEGESISMENFHGGTFEI